MGFGEEDHRGEETVSSHHFKGTYCQHDIIFDIELGHMAEVAFIGVPPVKLLFFSPFSYCALWKEDIMHSPHLRNGELCFPSWGQSKLFGILLQGRFVPFFLIFYLVNHVFVSIWTHGYLFYTLGYNPILLYFVAHIVPTLVIASLSVGSYVPFTYLHQCRVFCLLACLFLSRYLLSGTTWYSRLILYISCANPRISYFSKGPWFLLLENGIKNQDLGARWILCFGCCSIVVNSSHSRVKI